MLMRIVAIIFIIILLLTIFNIDVKVVFADEGENLLKSGIHTLDEINQNSKFALKNPRDDEALDKITYFVERKQSEVIWFLQVIAQPFAIIIFIINAYKTLIYSISSNKMLINTILGMLVSVIMYAVIIYAQVIMEILVNFIAT